MSLAAPTLLPFTATATAAPFPFLSSTTALKAKLPGIGLPLARCVSSSVRPREPSPHPLAAVFGASASLCASLGALPSDFPDRWRHLLKISEEAETKLAELPYHLIHAVTASEDLRFFHHPGVDPYGMARAVVYFPTGGGGSTITQQLMRRVFLTSERKASRKFVEAVLSLITEKRMSKLKILHSYLTTIYWGHGIYGIQSASHFYFGKHPSFLTVGESALLAGILPAPEILNPFTNLSRGKTSQIRVLRRMVAAGFIDLETALHIAKQPLHFRSEIEGLGCGGSEPQTFSNLQG